MGERKEGMQRLLQQCASKYQDQGILKLPIDVSDRGNNSGKCLTMCYDREQHPSSRRFSGPDFNFHGWPSANIPSFTGEVDRIRTASATPPRIPKAGWLGNIYSPLSDVPEHRTRPLLKQIGDAHPDLLDVVHIPGSEIGPRHPQYKGLPQLTEYKYLIDIGGNGWSGRLKFLLYTQRPLLVVERRYVDYFFEDLVPWKHYIPVSGDLGNLLERIEWAENHPRQCSAIADAALAFAESEFTHDRLMERIYGVYKELKN